MIHLVSNNLPAELAKKVDQLRFAKNYHDAKPIRDELGRDAIGFTHPEWVIAFRLAAGAATGMENLLISETANRARSIPGVESMTKASAEAFGKIVGEAIVGFHPVLMFIEAYDDDYHKLTTNSGIVVSDPDVVQGFLRALLFLAEFFDVAEFKGIFKKSVHELMWLFKGDKTLHSLYRSGQSDHPVVASLHDSPLFKNEEFLTEVKVAGIPSVQKMKKKIRALMVFLNENPDGFQVV